MSDCVVVYEAAAIADAVGTEFRPGAVAVRDHHIIAAGPIHQVNKAIDGPAQWVKILQTLILPAMVNAHAHLDLTTIGPRPFGGDFVDWVMGLMQLRPGDSKGLNLAVRRGEMMSLDSGVSTVGDIEGWLMPISLQTLAESTMKGVRFREFLGLSGNSLKKQIERLRSFEQEPKERSGMRLGLQPHAPYSTSPPLYGVATDLAVRQNLPICTHLAELQEELEFVGRTSGSFRRFLEDRNQWHDECRDWYGEGCHPVEWMEAHLKRTSWLLAHCNYVGDKQLEILVRTDASVAYCPVASHYFGHDGHRYRDMLDAGVNVCLGTDSILCQPLEESQPLSILAQMRFLYARDHTSQQQLLSMATVNGAKALGMPADHATLRPGAAADLCCVRIDARDPTEPLAQAMQNRYPCRPLPAYIELTGSDCDD